MIEVSSLHKSFGRNQVLRGIDLSFPQGKVTAVLGPNGSGKTTLLKSILGMVMPDKGDIRLDGQSVLGGWSYRNRIGYLPQIARFPENLKVRELVRMVKDIRAGEWSSLDEYSLQREEFLLDLFNLHPFLDKKLHHLSGGTRQKINILLAFLFNNNYYILDEPTAGLDPLSLIRFKELLRTEQRQGRTILITTHIINLVEEIADEIIFLLEGKIYFSGTMDEMKGLGGGRNLEHAIAQMLEKNRHA